MSAAASLAQGRRWKAWEIAILVALPLSWFAAGEQHSLLANEIAIFALFAVSLDLILGYAGIVSLGHAAFFGVGGGGQAAPAGDRYERFDLLQPVHGARLCAPESAISPWRPVFPNPRARA